MGINFNLIWREIQIYDFSISLFYRRVINDVAIWIYGGVTKLMEEEVQPLLVPAIIEHEGIGCITGGNNNVFI